jgi:hypothetical protein
VVGQKGALETEERWLLFSQSVQHEGKAAGAIELGFLVRSQGEGRKDRVQVLEDAALSVFFPTERETHTGFLIQGPYRTTLNRDNVPLDDLWNKNLMAKTATLLLAVLTRLRDADLFDAEALRTLPLNPAKFPEGSLGV